MFQSSHIFSCQGKDKNCNTKDLNTNLTRMFCFAFRARETVTTMTMRVVHILICILFSAAPWMAGWRGGGLKRLSLSGQTDWVDRQSPGRVG